jgi:hypothetical protein
MDQRGKSPDRQKKNPGGARFSLAVQNCPRAHPASCTMRTGSFPAVKRPGRGVDHPPQTSAEVKEIIELYFYFPSVPSGQVIGGTYFYGCRVVWFCLWLLIQQITLRTKTDYCSFSLQDVLICVFTPCTCGLWGSFSLLPKQRKCRV